MKTTILLGAGASKPYGFPLGPELKTIVTDFIGRSDTQQRLTKLEYNQTLFNDLSECLRYGRFQTIDEFLDAKKKFREIGGHIIVDAILSHERDSHLFPAHNWFSELFSKLHNKILTGAPLDLSIITLNYDRSLEYFLSKVTRYDCREEDESTVEAALQRIPIIHPHGSLGPIAELPYGFHHRGLDSPQVHNAGKNIQIVTDRLEESKAFNEAQNILGTSDRVLFIGFAYHPSTIKSLLNKIDTERTELVGTSLNLSEDRVKSINEWSKNRITLKPVKAEDFIREIVI